MGHPNPIFAWRSKFSDFLYKADPERPIRTIKAQGGQYTGPFHWENRPFTPDELKRLQTFPDEYELIGGKGSQIHQIGNSVPPQFSRLLAISVAQQLFAAESDLKISYLNANEELGFRKRKAALTKHYQETAQKAFPSVSNVIDQPAVEEFSSRVCVAQDFKFCLGQSKGYDLVSSVHDDTWLIAISELENKSASSDDLVIFINPKKTWNLGVKQVVLKSSECSRDAFLTLWKAFDFLLIENKFKADIVQLNGYYQYEPQIACSINFEPNWTSKNQALETVLIAITNGTITGKSLTEDNFANICSLTTDEVRA